MTKPLPELDTAERWRLLMGEAGSASLGVCGGTASGMDRALAWLCGREDSSQGSRSSDDVLNRHGGMGPLPITVPEWINQIYELFPKETIERLERDAIERYGIDEIVTNLDGLERATPSPVLLQAVMRTKHLMNPQVLAMARKLVEKVVRELIEKLAATGTAGVHRHAQAATAEPAGGGEPVCGA